ncbi:ribonuclease G [Verrucomicrobium sp. GAS474]|uniref:Rne/Rng family ribonuclease n=1 Tax=Verrucomicrobium sp. GAS474 TaxID=1882831 RepID=UPI000879C5B0|nr:Rne/Rng family ribonuclease [Verrucomicrobium sp. GAS474]SDU24356.1 ribonuclease G [Verrucomicrobium sp. GAS474]
MVLDKIREFFGFKKHGDEKEIIISCERLERRVALLEGGRLEEFAIERDSDRQISGNIYKGRVKNLESGLKAMFVDIGIDKNAFLHYWDAIPAALDSSVETIERGNKKKNQRRVTADDIPRLYPPGSDVIVQVTKGPIGTKGPRITTNISLAGRYLVLMPFTDQFGISRKIESQKERQRLRKILAGLDVPDGMGVIIRTVGEGQRPRFFVRDLAVLLEQWKKVEQKLQNVPAPALLLQEPDLVERTVRDFLTDEIDRIILDNEEEANRVKELIGSISKRSQKKIRYYNEATPIFERFNVDKQIDGAFRRQVWLPCGGYLVIDETEALVAVDVNTGRNKGGKDQDKTITQTNLEAAEEVARQLRLRNIGGLVIIDFIDMRDRKDQQAVVNKLKDGVRRDKAKTNILPISSLGLLEMTRQRVQESISRSLYAECPHCKGRGMVKSPETMSVEIQRAIIRILRLYPDVHELRIHVNGVVMERLKNEDEELLVDLERRFQGRLTFRVDPKLGIEDFKLVNVATDQEIDPKSDAASGAATAHAESKEHRSDRERSDRERGRR